MRYSTAMELVNSDLYRAFRWLEDNRDARMTADAKLGHLLVTFGGSYKRSEPEILKIDGLQVSCTGGTGNLLSAWSAKARRVLNGEIPKGGRK